MHGKGIEVLAALNEFLMVGLPVVTATAAGSCCPSTGVFPSECGMGLSTPQLRVPCTGFSLHFSVCSIILYQVRDPYPLQIFWYLVSPQIANIHLCILDI